MIRLVQRRLIIPRGDTGEFEVPVLKFTEGQHVAVFSIIDLRTRSIIYRKEIQVEGNSFKIEFTHNDTVNLPVGKYVWDIKFYKNPVYADEELIGGEEVDSYYSGFSLPDCEIRPTGDKLAMSDAAPAATLTPDQLDIITAAINEIHSSLSSAEDYADAAEAAWHLLESCSAEAVSVEPDEPASARYEDGTFYFEIPKGEVPDISMKADKTDTLLYTTLSRGRKTNTTIGEGSFAFGTNVTGSGTYSHVEGYNSTASGNISHAEGSAAIASGMSAHAEGSSSVASGEASHAEGGGSTASGYWTHAEGAGSTASGNAAHAEGSNTNAIGGASHAEGSDTNATGTASHAEGGGTTALGNWAHAEGKENYANGASSHAEGEKNVANGYNSHAEGNNTAAIGVDSHAEGYYTLAFGTGSHAEGTSYGFNTMLTGDGPTYTAKRIIDQQYVGSSIICNGLVRTIVSISDNIIEVSGNGFGTLDNEAASISTTGAFGDYSHTEGYRTTARDIGSHAEGSNTTARRSGHAEGTGAFAEGSNAHAEGYMTVASGDESHAEGHYTTVIGDFAHAEGKYTTAKTRSQHVFGEYNVPDPSLTTKDYRGHFVEIVGNGDNYNQLSYSNARALDWSGNEYLNGTLYINCDNESGNGEEVATISDIPTNISELINDESYITSADVPTDLSAFNNDVGYLTEHQDISGKINVTEKGAANGVAELDASGKIPSSQLPSYVDDVLEYANLSGFPVNGESGKIYVALDSNLTYRWSGSSYVVISSALALGETSETAYRGDRGAAAYLHSVTNKGNAFVSGFYKFTTNIEGHVTAATPVIKDDITALGIPGTFATDAEVQAIIDEYGQEEEGMLVETTWMHPSGEDPYFQTQTTAADILAAHKAGKNIVIHFPADENTQQFDFDCSLYTILTMYQQECAGSLHNETPREEKFFVAGGESSVGRYNLVGYGTILENGYVKFSIETDLQMA